MGSRRMGVPREARAFSTSIELKNSSRSLSGRAFSQKTGSHFSGKRSSYTLTHSWARELKRCGRTSLAAITFRLPDAETVCALYYNAQSVFMTAAQAAGLILAMPDPRGHEIIVPRRIWPKEIVHVQSMPRAVGWRYWPDAKGKPMRMCDCPVCMPRGEVKTRRYRERYRERMRAAGYMPDVDRPVERGERAPSRLDPAKEDGA